MENQLDNISKGKKIWHELCRECYNEMDNSSLDVKKTNMNDIEIDDKHTYFVGQYGPCIKYKENGKTKYKSAKKDLDIDKLNSPECGFLKLAGHLTRRTERK